MKAEARTCELCPQEAVLHCPSDAAFLCTDCDARVHRANFLVARHVRQTLCFQCKSLTGKFVSGERSTFSSSQHICPSCSTIASSPASSDCISSAESSAVNHIGKERKRVGACSSSVSDISGKISNKPPRSEKTVDFEAEGIFVIWCRRLGLNGNNNGYSIASLACQALELCLERSTVLPFRVCLVASFWAALRGMRGDRTIATWQNLRRLEAVSGVPAKVIVAVETRLARVMAARRRFRQDFLEEGWAECNA